MYCCFNKKRKKEAIFKSVLPKLLIFVLLIFSLVVLSGLVTSKNTDNSLENSKGGIFFDIKIIDFESPMELGEFFEFTYLVKGMADISDDIKIHFWIEKQGETITSGSDTIYIGNFEEKIETTKIFLPKNVESGVYDFIVEIVYEDYEAKSHRTIEIKIKKGIAKITTAEGKVLNTYLISALIGLAIFVLSLIFFLERKKIKKQFLQGERWIKKYRVSVLASSLVVITGILAYYLDLFQLIAKGMSKAVLWVRINVLPYFRTPTFYYILGITLTLIILAVLIIITKKKKLFKIFKEWLGKTKNKIFLRKRKADKLLQKKYKAEIKKSESEFKRVSKISDRLGKKLKDYLIKSKEGVKSLTNFLKKNIIWFIGLIKKCKRKEKKKTSLIKRLYKKRRREELIKRKKERKRGFIKKKREKKEELKKRKREKKKQLKKRKREKKKIRKKIQNIFKKTGIQIKRTAQFFVKKTKKRESILKDTKEERRKKKKERLEKKKELQKKKRLSKKRKHFFKKKRKLSKKKKKILEEAKRLEKRKVKKIRRKIKLQNTRNKYRIQIKKIKEFSGKSIKKISKINIKKIVSKFPKIKFPKRHPPKPIIKPEKSLKKEKKLKISRKSKIKKIVKSFKNKFKSLKLSIPKKEKDKTKGKKESLKNAKKQIKQIYKDVFKLLKKILRKKSKKKIFQRFETNLIKSGKFTQEHLKALKDIVSTKAGFKKKQLQTEFEKDKLNFQNKINKTRRNAAILINELTGHLNDLISFKKRKRIKTKESKKKTREGQKLIKDFFSKGITKKPADKSAEQLVKEVKKEKKKKINLTKVGNKLKKGVSKTFGKIFNYPKSFIFEKITKIRKRVKERGKLKQKPRLREKRESAEQLVKKIKAKDNQKKSVNKLKELIKKIKEKIFISSKKRNRQKNLERIKKMFEEKPQEAHKEEKPAEQPQEKTKEELDEILDKIEKAEKSKE